MKASAYYELKERIIALGYEDDVTWAENVGPCQSHEDFAREHCFVVCNSGMKAQIARKIFEKVWYAMVNGGDPALVFGHKGKVAAIVHVYAERRPLFRQWQKLSDVEEQLKFLESLPWIGGITKHHLAKNFGIDCCKPDRHLVRIATAAGTTPDELCARLAEETGNRIGVVDYVIWRAANLRLV